MENFSTTDIVTLVPSFTTEENVTKMLKTLPFSILICAITSCCISILGAVVIFLSYCLVVNQKNKIRRLLMYMTIADLMTTIGNLTGTIRYAALIYGDNITGQYSALVNNTPSVDICIMQSFVTSYSSLSSFFWTLAISITLILTVMHESDFCYKMKGTLLAHFLCWGSPLVIVMVAASFDVLGENFDDYHSLPWCWIKGNTAKGDPWMWMLLTGNIWQILAYLITAVNYILLKHFMRRKRKHNRSFGFRNISRKLRNEDENFAYVWLVLYLLRFWGTLRFFLSFMNVHSETLDSVLAHFQVIGNCAQSFCNCILFVVFDKSIRTGMINALCDLSSHRNDGESDERDPLYQVV